MTASTYKLVFNKPGLYKFTMPDGFLSNVQVNLYGAGGGTGSDTGAPGGGGQYVQSNLNIFSGNTITVEVGGAGQAAISDTGGANFGAPIPPTPYTLFDNGFDDYYSQSSTGQFYAVQTQLAGYFSTVFANVSAITDSGGVGPRSFTAYLNSGYSLSVFHTHAAGSNFTSADGKITFYQNGYNSGIYSNTQASGPAYSWLHFYVNGTHAGTTINLSYYGGKGGSVNTQSDDGHEGGGGAGGGATAIVVNGIPMAIAAGGGGGGGGHGYQIGLPGLPGGIQNSYSNWYPVSSYAWSNFMNTYAIWTGGVYDVTTYVYTTTVTFPTSGTYTFIMAADNSGNLQVDGSQVVTAGGFTGSGNQATANVSAGTHTITMYVTNAPGGGYNPAGGAAKILNPSNSELWDTRNPQNYPQLNTSSYGTDGSNAYAAGGGGGGGIFGGLGGPGVGDDAGQGGPGNGGQGLGDYKINGSGTVSGGFGLSFAPPSTGNAGYDGYAVLTFQRKLQMYIKNAGSWNLITNVYYKQNNAWVPVNQMYTKTGTGWNPLLSTNIISPDKLV